MGLLWEANAGTVGIGASPQEEAASGAEAESGESMESEESVSEEEALGAGADMAEPEEQVEAVLQALEGEFAGALQGAYWAILGYFAASIVLGIAIFGFLRLQPRRG
jgi:hypothetical protein